MARLSSCSRRSDTATSDVFPNWTDESDVDVLKQDRKYTCEHIQDPKFISAIHVSPTALFSPIQSPSLLPPSHTVEQYVDLSYHSSPSHSVSWEISVAKASVCSSSSSMSSPLTEHQHQPPMPAYPISFPAGSQQHPSWLDTSMYGYFGSNALASTAGGSYMFNPNAAAGCQDFGASEYLWSGDFEDKSGGKSDGFVDPSLIQPIESPPASNQHYSIDQQPLALRSSAPPTMVTHPVFQADPWGTQSSYEHPIPQHQIPHSPHASVHSSHSIHSNPSHVAQSTPESLSFAADEENKSRTKCPYSDCGKTFKDLKAHLLTHQDERPEKCPIARCEFYKRGFARKYDRNRHLVTTHYKSTFFCGFCPGSSSSSEKSFKRADVFKRHLVSVHGVGQTPPNGRKKRSSSSARQSPGLIEGGSGQCSTCGNIFGSAQYLFEHLDDCVLRVVQRIDLSEATNERNLGPMFEDEVVKSTLERHNLSTALACHGSNGDEEIGGMDTHEDAASNARSGRSSRDDITPSVSSMRDARITKNTFRPTSTMAQRSAGITYSKRGVALSTTPGIRRKKSYPRCWGCSAETMKLKKRVLCVFDGQRRLWKDDMMLGNDHEVKMQLPGSDVYVTDLDVESVKRAEAFHGASEEEKRPWVLSNVPDFDVDRFMAENIL